MQAERLSFAAPKGTRRTLDTLTERLGYKKRGGRGDLIRAALASAHPSTIEGALDKRPRTEPRSAAGGRLWGEPTAIYLPPLGDSQQPRELRARYAVVEAAKLLNSNDPTQGFRKRAGYPASLQPRDYAGDVTERLKVERIAAVLKPSELVNDAPSALTGPPILLPGLAVAGGNGRSMAVQLAYRDNAEPSKEYRAHLQSEAAHYGLDPAEVAQFAAPVLVRVLDEDPKSLRELGHDLNTATGNALDALHSAVAESERLTPSIIEALAKIDPDESLSAFLAGDRALRQAIQQAVPAGMRSALFDKRGELTEAGQTWLTWALLGKLLPSAALLDSLGPKLRGSLGAAAPFFLIAGRKPAWDVSEDLARAVRLVSAARAQSVKTVQELRTGSAFTGVEGAEEPTEGASKRAALLAEILLSRSGPRQLQGGARRYEQAASGAAQASLFGGGSSPLEALSESFGVAVPRVYWTAAPKTEAAPKAAPKTEAPEPKEEPEPAPEPKGRALRAVRVVTSGKSAELYPVGLPTEDAERLEAEDLAGELGGELTTNTDKEAPGRWAARLSFDSVKEREAYLNGRNLPFLEVDPPRAVVFEDGLSLGLSSLTTRQRERIARTLSGLGFVEREPGSWGGPRSSLTKTGQLKGAVREELKNRLWGVTVA
jgi:hypothetical protein